MDLPKPFAIKSEGFTVLIKAIITCCSWLQSLRQLCILKRKVYNT